METLAQMKERIDNEIWGTREDVKAHAKETRLYMEVCTANYPAHLRDEIMSSVITTEKKMIKKYAKNKSRGK